MQKAFSNGLFGLGSEIGGSQSPSPIGWERAGVRALLHIASWSQHAWVSRCSLSMNRLMALLTPALSSLRGRRGRTYARFQSAWMRPGIVWIARRFGAGQVPWTFEHSERPFRARSLVVLNPGRRPVPPNGRERDLPWAGISTHRWCAPVGSRIEPTTHCVVDGDVCLLNLVLAGVLEARLRGNDSCEQHPDRSDPRMNALRSRTGGEV